MGRRDGALARKSHADLIEEAVRQIEGMRKAGRNE